jgi:hypothetical protein
MLELPRYLLGVAEVAILTSSAILAGFTLRKHLVPELAGAPAHLATTVLALAMLIWAAELLGTLGAFEPLPYLLFVGGLAVAAFTFLPRVAPQGGPPRGSFRYRRGGGSPAATGPAGRRSMVPAAAALAIAALAVLRYALELKPKLSTGMTGFDSTWYHGPFAAGFFQDGDTWGLHQIAPQFLSWFYPANAELFHAIGMSAFDRDLLSPLLNLGWFAGCLAACWCIGRPYGAAPWSLALGAVALSVPALSDQAGEARNDIVAIFFLLAGVALALNVGRGERAAGRGEGEGLMLPGGALFVVGLAAGLALGTKLNFLLPGAALVVGVSLAAGPAARGRAFAASLLGVLAGGGYWYLRNLLHSGNPLPWFDSIGPIPLPAPDQPLGGREGHSVLGYLGDGGVWSDWLLPGLHEGLTLLWPVLLAGTLAGLLLCLTARGEPLLRLAGVVGLAAALAWLVAPTSASGPEGVPRGFESGLRYLAPALVLGLALLPTVPPLRARLSRLGASRVPPRQAPNPVRSHFFSHSETNSDINLRRRGAVAVALLMVVVAVAAGYPVQRHYLENRYADPTFTTPGLSAAFGWSRSVADARIATTSTRQYPLFGTDLSNDVRFVGEERPHGGFVAPTSCRAWRRLLNEGEYDYVVASRDRIERSKPPFPPSAKWTEGPNAMVVLREPPTVVFKLSGPLDPSACRR